MTNVKKIISVGIICFSLIFASYGIFIVQEFFTPEDVEDPDEYNIEIHLKLKFDFRGFFKNPFLPYNQNNLPKGLKLTFIHGFNDSIVISWYTELCATDPTVTYSLNYDLSSSIEVKPNSTEIVPFTIIYTAELMNLSPNTTYYYQIRSDQYNKREIINFTTLGNNNNNRVRFLVYGDSRTQRDVRKTLVEKIMNDYGNDFEFTILLGDIVENGRDQVLWNNFFEDFEKINAYKQGIYVEGNHERGLETKMYDNLPMMSNGTNRHYSLSYEGIGFIILNSNDYTINDDVQTNWLNQTLIKFSKENTYNFAFMHHPLLNDSRSYLYHREKWRPLFEKYNVTCIFAGHNHHYERSFPIINCTTLEYDDSEFYNFTHPIKPIYFVSGSCGAPLYSVNTQDYMAKTTKNYHFLLIEVSEKDMKSTISLETWVMPEDFGDLYLADNITITRWN